MNTKKKIKIVTASVVALYSVLIIGWHFYTPHTTLAVQNPGSDNRPEGQARKADDVLIGEYFMKNEELTNSDEFSGAWSCFRGEKADNIIRTTDEIYTGEKDYPMLWSVTTGEGHAAPVIYKGRVYLLDYNEQMSADELRCFALETGKELWRRWYRVPMKRNHGFSRTIPVVSDDYLITLGPEGHIMCCDPISGDMKWTLDMKKTYSTEVPFWYTGQCPRVDNGVLLIAPAGEEVLMAGIDVQTGEEVWRTPNTVKFKMSHSSIMPMTLSGKATYVYIGIGGICGVSASGADQGTLLWSTDRWQPTVVAPSPLQLSSNRIFAVAGYGTGAALIQVDRTNNQWNATVVEQYKPNAGLSSEQQTPILYENMIISVMPKDGGALRDRLVCYSPNNLHTALWSSAADERFGLGPYLAINNKLFVFKDDGELYLYQIEQHGMKLLKKQKIMDGIDAWGPLAYANGILIVRDGHHVVALKVN